MDEGVKILELARDAQAVFERQPAREKRRLSAGRNRSLQLPFGR